MVRDKFICGLRNEKLRAILMNDDQITTSAQALAKAISRENSDAAAHVMNVNTVKYKQYGLKKRFIFNNNSRNNSAKRSSKPDGASNSGGSVCTKCTLKGHVAENCYTKCRLCNKSGHIHVNCPKLQKRKVNTISAGADDRDDTGDSDTNVVNHVGHDASTSYEYDYAFHVTLDERESATNTSNGVGREMCESVDVSNDNSCLSVNENSSVLRKQPVCLNNDNTFPYIEFPFDIVNHVGKKTLNGSDRPLKVMINGKYLNMEVDTGSEVTCISKYVMEKLNLTGCSEIKRCSLVVANGQSVSCVNTSVFVKYRDVQHRLGLRVVDARFPTLLGRYWMDVLLGRDLFDRLIEVKHVETFGQTRNGLLEELKSSPIYQPGVGRFDKHEAC